MARKSKRKARLKKTAKNEFTALSGVLAIQTKDCLIATQQRVGTTKVQRYAYMLYNDLFELSTPVKSTCKEPLCVKQDHLYSPLSAEQKRYIFTYHKIDSPEVLAHRLDLTVDSVNEYLKILK